MTNKQDTKRIIRELRKLGRIERERMRKGASYKTWSDRGADVIESMPRTYKPDSAALKQAMDMLRCADYRARWWKLNFVLLLIAIISCLSLYFLQQL